MHRPAAVGDAPVSLTLPADRFLGVARLVIGGVGARSQLSYESVDDLQLAVELVLRSGYGARETATISIDHDSNGVSVSIGPVDPGVLKTNLAYDGGEVELLTLLARLVDGVVGQSEPEPAIVLRKALGASQP
jgi:hypothetical protein